MSRFALCASSPSFSNRLKRASTVRWSCLRRLIAFIGARRSPPREGTFERDLARRSSSVWLRALAQVWLFAAVRWNASGANRGGLLLHRIEQLLHVERLREQIHHARHPQRLPRV